MNATLNDLASKIRKAKVAQDVVGPDDDGRANRLKKIRLVLHPDKWLADSDKAIATESFKLLEQLVTADYRKSANKFDITTKTATYHVDGLEFEGLVANLYECIYIKNSAAHAGLVKMARNPSDNDLLAQEAKVLKDIFKEPHHRGNFYPELVDTFVHRDATTHADRRTNVLRRTGGFISLAKVQSLFGEDHRFDARDLAWMWRRVYAGLSLAHELGYVHGAISPDHVLIWPEEHGLQIVGWGQSVEIGDTIKLLGDDRNYLYAPEVFEKKPATPATDLYAISRLFERLLKRDLTEPGVKQFRAFIKGTAYESQSARPQDARVLLGEFDDLMDRTFRREFRPFVLPSN